MVKARLKTLALAIVLGFLLNALVTLLVSATLDPERFSSRGEMGPVGGEHWLVKYRSRPGAERVFIDATPVINRGWTETGPVAIIPKWVDADPEVSRLGEGVLKRADRLDARGWPMLCVSCLTQSTTILENRTVQDPEASGGVELPLPPWPRPLWRAEEPRVLPLRPLWTGLLVNWTIYTLLASLVHALVRQRRRLRPYRPRPRPVSLVALALALGFVITVLVVAGLGAFADPYRFPALGVPGGDDEVGEYWTIWSVSRPGLQSASVGRERIGGQRSLLGWQDVLPGWLAGEPAVAPLTDDLSARAGQFAARGWPAPCAWYTIRTTVIPRTAPQRETGISGGIKLPLAPWSSPAGIGLGSEPRVIPLRPIWGGLMINWLVYGALALPVLMVVRQLRYAWRRRRGRCVACGYDLRHGYDRGCSECGWKPSGASLRSSLAIPHS